MPDPTSLTTEISQFATPGGIIGVIAYLLWKFEVAPRRNSANEAKKTAELPQIIAVNPVTRDFCQLQHKFDDERHEEIRRELAEIKEDVKQILRNGKEKCE